MRLPPLSLHPVLFATILVAGCDVRSPVQDPAESRPVVQRQAERRNSEPAQGSVKARQAEFLNRIRSSDPQGRVIDRALINDDNELGLILDRSVQLDDIPKLMRSMLTQMAKEFPGEDLNVIAYTPSNPPRKIGTGHLNAQTREMTYTREP